MTLKEFKEMDIFKTAKEVKYYNRFGDNVTSLITKMSTTITNRIVVIGTSFNADGTIDIDLSF